MDTIEIKDFLKDILCQNCWDDIDKKARAVFTTVCLMEEIENNEKIQNQYLSYLYKESEIGETDTLFTEFKDFMTADL